MAVTTGWRLAGRYRLVEELGAGGMAVVWRAHDEHMHRQVAVKLLRDSYGVPHAADRFAREARLAGNLSSPHIVTVYDFGRGRLEPGSPDAPRPFADELRSGAFTSHLTPSLMPRGAPSPDTDPAATADDPAGDPGEGGAGAEERPPSGTGAADRDDGDDDAPRSAMFVVMELLRGRNLAQIVTDPGPLPVARVVDWARQLCVALETAHGEGVLHRDIKPANVMVTDRGVLKVLDFGIARFMKTLTARQVITSPGSILGTAAYMSPEQARGEPADLRSDLYAAGCLIYELLVGEPPFGLTLPTPTLLFRHVHDRPVPPAERRPGIPPELNDLVMWLLAKDPADRAQDAASVSAALARVPAREPEPLPTPGELARRLTAVAGRPPDDAVRLLRGLLRDHLRVHGPEHPLTLGVRDDLAYYLGAAGDPRAAVRLLKALVSDHGRALGAEHPDTLRIRRNLAHWTAKAGAPAQAARLLRELVPDHVQVHGEHHEETFRVRRELALCAGRSGDVREAVRLLRDLVADMTRALGADHPRAGAAREDLTYWEHRLS